MNDSYPSRLNALDLALMKRTAPQFCHDFQCFVAPNLTEQFLG